jgi:hypothetical protein
MGYLEAATARPNHLRDCSTYDCDSGDGPQKPLRSRLVTRGGTGFAVACLSDFSTGLAMAALDAAWLE